MRSVGSLQRLALILFLDSPAPRLVHRTACHQHHTLPSFSAPLQVCLEYLERYFVLICFVSYIYGAHFPPACPAALSFGEWLGARPELRSILERLLRYNPAAALGLNKEPGALAASEWRGAAQRPALRRLGCGAVLAKQLGWT